jgi:hypothetical protein
VRHIAVSIVLVLGLGACAGGSRSVPTPTVRDTPPPVLPASALPRMTSVVTDVDEDQIADEVVHREALIALLEAAGFAGSRQRSFTVGTGSFSRVIARGLSFDTAGGARAYVTWFSRQAGEEILTAERIPFAAPPAGVVVFRHVPDGCCHNDVPTYLAAWQRGSTVLTLHAGGRKANAAAFADLVSAYDEET